MLRYIALALLSAFVVSDACSCVPKKSLDEQYCKYDTVLKVKIVTQIMLGDRTRKVYHIEVQDVFKGDKNKTSTELFTASSSAACGATFETDVEYLIFPDKEFPNKGGYSVSSCSYPNKWSDVSTEDRQKLEKGQFQSAQPVL